MGTPNGAGPATPAVPSAVLSAKIDYLAEEFRDWRRTVVPRGEYEIARASDLARLAAVEAQQRQQGDRRWQVGMAMLGAFLGMVASIVAAVAVISH